MNIATSAFTKLQMCLICITERNIKLLKETLNYDINTTKKSKIYTNLIEYNIG